MSTTPLPSAEPNITKRECASRLGVGVRTLETWTAKRWIGFTRLPSSERKPGELRFSELDIALFRRNHCERVEPTSLTPMSGMRRRRPIRLQEVPR